MSLSNASSSSIESQKTRTRSRHLPQTSQSRLATDTHGQGQHRQHSGQRGNSHVDSVHASGKRHDSKESYSGRGNGRGGNLKDEIDSGYVGSTRSHVTDQFNPSRQESQRTRYIYYSIQILCIHQFSSSVHYLFCVNIVTEVCGDTILKV